MSGGMWTQERAIAHEMLSALEHTAIIQRLLARSLTESLHYEVTAQDVGNAVEFLQQRLDAPVAGETLTAIVSHLAAIEQHLGVDMQEAEETETAPPAAKTFPGLGDKVRFRWVDPYPGVPPETHTGTIKSIMHDVRGFMFEIRVDDENSYVVSYDAIMAQEA